MVRSNFRQVRLASISIRLKEINTARTHLLHQLEELDAESRALQVERKSIFNDNAVISALLNELLSNIFELGHDSQAPKDHFEILVSSVTKHWRDVALGTPKLWTIILCEVFEQQLERITLYLYRSKAATIDLRIVMRGMNSISQKDTRDLWQLLTAHFGRCHRLVVDAVDPPGLRLLLKLLRHLRDVRAPLLRRIEISCSDEWFEDEGDDILPPQAQIFIGGTPLLNTISLVNIGLQCCLPPLGSVTTIYLHGVSPPSALVTSDEWMKMISSASSLIHLEIHGDLVVDEWIPSDAFELRMLRTLALDSHGDGDAWFHGFLGCMMAPRLEVLTLKNFSPEETNGIDPNPLPSLHTLILEMYTGLNELDSLENLLAAFPGIRHVVCSGAHSGFRNIYDNFLSLLTPGEHSSQTLMPRLRTIALLSAYDVIPWLVVRDLLTARKSISQHIHKLFIPESRSAEVSAALTLLEGMVQVEAWKPELVQGWPAWTSLP